ncbi:hypothetical protein AGMMS49975_04950 [Clostridia bacterium]|nr:hypothetical protein AGMMS49975_04950 [Clostridia bacterium]
MKKRIFAFFTFCVVIFGGNTAFARTVFSDVPESSLQFPAISKMAELGVIVGDTEGKFRPNDYIDKFETAKVLARISGYDPIDGSDADKSFYARAFDKNRTYLAQYANMYANWNTSCDREIAYLLEKEILTPDDLKTFVGKKADGEEGVFATTKETAAMFLVKAVNKKDAATAAALPTLYLDDTQISAAARPYVYYLKNLDANTRDLRNNFSPKQAITRADFAVLSAALSDYFSLPKLEERKSLPNFQEPPTEVLENFDAVFDGTTASGGNVYAQFILDDNTKKLYKAATPVSVTVNGFMRTVEDLPTGARVRVILKNNMVADIKADTVGGGNFTIDDGENVTLVSVSGVISGKSSDLAAKTITLKLASGELNSYVLAETAKITREGEAANFDALLAGDVSEAKISGSKIYELNARDKTRQVEGLLTETEVDKNGVVTLTLKPSASAEFTRVLLNGAMPVTRDAKKATWKELRIGDLLKITCEYDTATELSAYGTKQDVFGIVSNISIDSKKSTLTLATGEAYNADNIDIYSLRVGDTVKLRLDSGEIYALSVSQKKQQPYVIGFVTSIDETNLTILDISSKILGETTVQLTEKTVFLDENGSDIEFSEIKENVKVRVMFDGTRKNAVSVTIM